MSKRAAADIAQGLSEHARTWLKVLDADTERFMSVAASLELCLCGCGTVTSDNAVQITKLGRDVAKVLAKETGDRT